MKRRVCVITGTRADYGILYPVMKAISNSHGLKLYIVATCMHLMKEFGYTIKEIQNDGFDIYEKVDISYREDTGEAMAFSVGKAISLFSRCFAKLRPHIVVVLGDRGEMLAAAIAANYMNIPVAHIHGGEISGHIDGLLRHAITKLSHIHFPATEQAKRRILNLGEEAWRIFRVGAPALDRILGCHLPKPEDLTRKYQIKQNKPAVLLIQHPVSTEVKQASDQIKITLEALSDLGLQILIVYPNADAGGRKMIRVIKEYVKDNSLMMAFKNIPHEDYLGLMRVVSVLVGNSSSGIIEAPSFKLPVVNIGIRQDGRERSTNVIDVPHDKNAIVKAIKKALYDKKFREQVKRCKNPYGDGHAAERIVKVLSTIKLDKKLLQKQITY
uniref:UDP-N-acetylglucosamine 2-epimerase (Hydrolyzing) n=1 Tax=candidate division CPR3 bacterium TaxID=2268181 RepID=A0A7V3J924_UNCC3